MTAYGETTWREITEKRPPQNETLLWARYYPLDSGEWVLGGVWVGVYRFGVVRGSGWVPLPGPDDEPRWPYMRYFWRRLGDLPHDSERCEKLVGDWEEYHRRESAGLLARIQED